MLLPMGFQIYWLTQKQNNNNDGNNCYALFYLVAKLHFFLAFLNRSFTGWILWFIHFRLFRKVQCAGLILGVKMLI